MLRNRIDDAPRAKRCCDETIPVLARWFGSWRVSVDRRAMSPAELTDAYDREAPGWNRTLEFLRMQSAYRSALQVIMERTNGGAVSPPLRALDCGVGDGAFSAALGEVLTAPIEFDAVDLSPRMLALAGARLNACGLSARLHHSDARTLPFTDYAFDIALTAHMLEHLAEPQAALQEIVRVLKPGGLLVACITRQSMLGRYIQTKWRTHAVTRREGEAWLRSQGLRGVFSLGPIGHQAFDRMSFVCAGRKALSP